MALLDDLCSVCLCFNHIMVHAKKENPCQTLWGLEGNQRRTHHTLAWHKASVPSVRDDGDLRANTVNDKQCRTCWASQGQWIPMAVKLVCLIVLFFWETVAHGYLQARLGFPSRFVRMFASCGDQAERKKDQYSWVDFLHQPYWNPTICDIYIQVERINHCWVSSNPISRSPHRLFCRLGNAVGRDGWASRADRLFTICFFYFSLLLHIYKGHLSSYLTHKLWCVDWSGGEGYASSFGAETE